MLPPSLLAAPLSQETRGPCSAASWSLVGFGVSSSLRSGHDSLAESYGAASSDYPSYHPNNLGVCSHQDRGTNVSV